MLLCKSTVPVLVSFQDAIYWEMLRQCCRQNIPLSQFACFWSHDFTTHHSLCEKNRCDREWNQFKKIQISFCNIFKYKWLLGQPGHQGRVYMWVCGTGNLPVSKKGSEQTQIGRRIREEGVRRRPSVLLSRSYWMHPAVCTFWKIYLMETWTHHHTFIRKAELLIY